MIFPDFDPVIFSIGPVAIRWYALAYIAGIVLGWLYVRRLSANAEVWGSRYPVATRDQVEDLVLYTTAGVIVGGRLGYMLFYNTSAIWTDPLEIVKIWKGGMSFHGGLVGVILGFLWVAKLHRIDVLKLSDLAAPAIPIGLFFGRIANFVNAELWGRETYAPWGVIFCNDSIQERLNGCPAGPSPRHPSQLYEAGLEGIVLLVVLWLAVYKWDWLKRRGLVTGAFLTLYGVFRILVETVREPDVGLENFPLGLTMGMILSVPMVLGGLYLIARSRGAKGEAAAGVVDPSARTAQVAVKAAIGGLAGGGVATLADEVIDVDSLPDEAEASGLIASGTVIGAAAGMAGTEAEETPAPVSRPAKAPGSAPKAAAKPKAKAKAPAPATKAAAPKDAAKTAAVKKPASKPKPKK